MYLLVAFADVIQLHPSEFGKPSNRAIEDLINAKYADKVIHKVGLVVCFHSIISASQGLIGHGTGVVNVNVDFRLIVFRPFKGEIVHATITNSDPSSGVHLSQGFFEDIVVPPETLFENTRWERDDQGIESFVWTENDNQYFFDRAESCLYRVEDEQWRDTSPQIRRPGGKFIAEEPEEKDQVKKKTPYLIRGSMMHSGLGPTLWWTGEVEEGQQSGS